MNALKPRKTFDPRAAIWIALSDLFLDTELPDDWMEETAEQLRHSRFSPRELDDIFRYELAPALGGNLFGVAGLWSGFDPDWVCKQAARNRRLPRGWTWLVSRYGVMMAGRRWSELKALAFPSAARRA